MDYKQFLYEEFPILLRGLKAETPALWGKMNAHQMVEHLTLIVGGSNGRFEMKPTAEPERLAYRKMRFLEKDTPFPKGVRVEFISEEPITTRTANIEDAKMQLFDQLQRFDDYYKEHPGMMAMHAVFGPLNFEEWIQFHTRHKRHHLMQFGIVPMPV